MSKNDFFIEKYENLKVDIKMYMSEISKSKWDTEKSSRGENSSFELLK